MRQNQATIVKLVDSGLSYADIAVILGMSRQAVRQSYIRYQNKANKGG